MARLNQRLRTLPDIFPPLGPVTRSVLFADFERTPPALTPYQWYTEYPVLIGHGLAGIALRLARQHALDVPAAVVHDLEDAHFSEVTTTFRMTQCSRDGLAALRASGIPLVVTKGPGIAQAHHPMSERTFSDIDVVVPPRSFSAAFRVLRALGYQEQPQSVQPWPSHRRTGREATNLRTSGGGSIDLHHRISPWNWSHGLSFRNLEHRAHTSTLSGLSVALASTEDKLLIAALHVVSDKSQPGLSYRVWRDLLVLARASAPDRVAEVAGASGMCGWLSWILSCLPEEVRPSDLMTHLGNRDAHIPRTWRLQLLLHTEREHLLNPMYRLPLPGAVFTVCGSLVPSPRYLRLQYPDTDHRYLTRWHNLVSRFPYRAAGMHPTSSAQT